MVDDGGAMVAALTLKLLNAGRRNGAWWRGHGVRFPAKMPRRRTNDETTEVKPQSAELAGGAGFTFEDAVGALYLAALLGETHAPGVLNRTVSQVAFQQRNFGEPLDDVIVDFRTDAGDEARLSLQVKRALTISAAKTNADFRDVIRDSWLTYKKTNFRKGTDRYGAVVENVARTKSRDLQRVCELARASESAAYFEKRFTRSGDASQEQKIIRDEIVRLLKEAKGEKPTALEIHEFFAGFVLIELDFMHEGATDTALAMSHLRECVLESQAAQAPLLWSKLCHMTRQSGGNAGVYDRKKLVREVGSIVRLRGAVSLRNDLVKVSALTRACLEDIPKDVAGTHVARNALVERLTTAMAQRRFVQITGLAGSGKSVLLREQVERELAAGHVLFLKSDRLAGTSWATFAQGTGLSGASLPRLLTEIAATGSSTLYIDGIDRVDKKHRLVILDVLRTLMQDPNLSHWKVVVSLRDSGLEPLRNWLAEVLSSMSVGTVDVEELTDEDAEGLAKAQPTLRALLFGPAAVREVVRRPFFAKVLSQRLTSGGNEQSFQPQCEIDLIENWWKRGGYGADGQDAIGRQRAIVDIGQVRARQLSQPVRIAQLKPETTNHLDSLLVDGILQYERHGITVKFAHDIFFEWSFFYVLVERDDQWLEQIRESGEPPAVGRVVELLSQLEYRDGDRWMATLNRVAVAQMRSQWMRAWLLGPLSSPAFKSNENVFAAAVSENGFALLRKALVWFQAEKTVPSANILQSDLPVDQRIRSADLFGWPSDFSAWRRLISFLLERDGWVPALLYPNMVAIFEVWENALPGWRNDISEALLNRCADWLRKIDTLEEQDVRGEQLPRQAFVNVDDLRQSLCSLLLRSAASMPDLAEEYLKRVLTRRRLRDDRYKEVMTFAPILAGTHPALLVSLALKHLRKDLPEEQIEREEQRRRQRREQREEILAKPEAERTEVEKRVLNLGREIFPPSHVSHRDWEGLCIADEAQAYWPPSPLREPFHSLFKTSPQDGLELFAALCNHAVEAWRELHRLDDERGGTPIPLEIRFPWGVQQFWGDSRAYVWSRGTGAPHALGCGFLALEEWCLGELDGGRDVDELIQQVLAGNQSIGILGVAVMLILHTQRLSETGFAIVTAQRLWSADINRMVNDQADGSGRLIGLKRSDEAHIAAIKAANARPVRRVTLRWFVMRYVLSEEFGERTEQAGLAFKERLPFQYEEEKRDEAARAYFLKQANDDAEVCTRKNYRIRRSSERENMFEVVHESPSASTPEKVRQIEELNRSEKEARLWLWVSKSFEHDKVDDSLSVPKAIELARELDERSLFKSRRDEEGLRVRRGAIAGAAALVLKFREERTKKELRWARMMLARALHTPEVRNGLWTAGAIIPWHPSIFVARGLVAEIWNGTAGDGAKRELLALVAHPLEVVALAAVAEVATLWDKEAKFVWAALWLAFDLCRVEPPSDARSGFGGPLHSPERVNDALAAAIQYDEHPRDWPALPLPPPAWVKRAEQASSEGVDEDEDAEVRTSGGLRGDRGEWTEPRTRWHSEYSGKLLARVPFQQVLASDAKQSALAFLTSLLEWTNAKNEPPWQKKGRRESSHLFEWTAHVGWTLGEVAGYLPLAEVRARFLTPIFALEDEACWSLLSAFSSRYICRYIYDAPIMPEGTMAVVGLCIDRFLKSPAFKRDSHSAGRFSGFVQPGLLDTLMFVAVDDAPGAARYANGNWSQLELLLPPIERVVQAGGWSVRVMANFLTFAERAREAYPADRFAEQVLAVLGSDGLGLKGWFGSLLPARIAGLVQFFADRNTPMSAELAQQMLRILDVLVDMGDRRSAALELSEVFREVTV